MLRRLHVELQPDVRDHPFDALQRQATSCAGAVLDAASHFLRVERRARQGLVERRAPDAMLSVWHIGQRTTLSEERQRNAAARRALAISTPHQDGPVGAVHAHYHHHDSLHACGWSYSAIAQIGLLPVKLGEAGRLNGLGILDPVATTSALRPVLIRGRRRRTEATHEREGSRAAASSRLGRRLLQLAVPPIPNISWEAAAGGAQAT